MFIANPSQYAIGAQARKGAPDSRLFLGAPSRNAAIRKTDGIARRIRRGWPDSSAFQVHGRRIVREDENRNGHPTIPVGSSDDAITAGWQVDGLWLLSHAAEIIVDHSDEMAIFGKDLVIGMVAPIFGTIEMRLRIERRENYQGAVGADRWLQVGRRSDRFENKAVSRRRAAL